MADVARMVSKNDMALHLKFDEIFRYLQCNEDSRNLSEGENVLNGGLLIACGCTQRLEFDIHVLGLVLQTSALSKDPHQVTGHLTLKNDKLIIVEFACTCKAGLSSKCKHISAVLWFLNRTDIEHIEDLSVTDTKCLWAQKKTSSLSLYAPVPLTQFCHIKDRVFRTTLPEDFYESVRNDAMNIAPDSSYSKHRQGRLPLQDQATSPTIADTTAGPSTRDNFNTEVSASSSAPNTSIITEKEDELFNHALGLFNCGVCSELEKLPAPDDSELRPCCKVVYERLKLDKLAAINLCVATASTRCLWEESRKFRITGSRCYEIFTAGQKKEVDWASKATKYFWPKPFSSSATRHGIKNEPLAREIYKMHFNANVVEFGLIINPLHPWLGYSPDGVVFENDVPTKLIEIKCPVNGGKVGVEALIHQCSFLKTVQGEEKHKYYGQVQLGMALVNVPTCDLVVYSPFDESLAVVPVPYNAVFTKNMLNKLKKDFFEHMLHQICVKEMEKV